MKDERNEHLKRLAVAQVKRVENVAWKLTDEDRRFLRSLNVSPE